MSLHSLREMRRAGRKPAGVVQVLVGNRPKWRDDTPAFIHIRPGDEPTDLDWRPVIGLWVVLFVNIEDRALAGRVLQSLGDAGAKLYGAADLDGTYPCIVGADERHRRNLRASLEQLCQ